MRTATPDAPPAEGGRRSPLKALTGALLTVAYPALVYVALTAFGPRAAGLTVAALVVPRAALSLRRARREDVAHALRVPLTVGALALASAGWRDGRFLLALPTLVNLSLLAHFASSLRTETPIVERFARMQVPDLTDDERVWCRGVTVGWCAFFLANAATAAALALAAPPAWWALYTGALSYVAVGAMFTAEYVLRSHRFRRYGAALPDRIMARLLPPRRAA